MLIQLIICSLLFLIGIIFYLYNKKGSKFSSPASSVTPTQTNKMFIAFTDKNTIKTSSSLTNPIWTESSLNNSSWKGGTNIICAVQLKDGTVAVVNGGGFIYTTPSLINPSWTLVEFERSVKQILELQNNKFAVVCIDGSMWLSESLTNPSWTQVNANNVSQLYQLKDGEFVVLTKLEQPTPGYIYTTPNLENPIWGQVNPGNNVENFIELQNGKFAVYGSKRSYISTLLIKDLKPSWNGKLPDPGWKEVTGTMFLSQVLQINDSIEGKTGTIVAVTTNISPPNFKENLGRILIATNFETPVWTQVKDISNVIKLLEIDTSKKGPVPVPAKVPVPVPAKAPVPVPKKLHTSLLGFINNIYPLYASGPYVIEISDNLEDTLKNITSYLKINNIAITQPYNYVSIFKDGGFRIYNVPDGSTIEMEQYPYVVSNTYSLKC